MYSKISLYTAFNSFLIYFLLLFLPIISLLEASVKFGKTEKVFDWEGHVWNQVCFADNDHLIFLTAAIPNYSGATVKNGITSLRGNTDDNAGYLISITDPGFTPPSSLEKFIEMIQEAYPNHLVIPDDVPGVKYAVDLEPDSDEGTYWRFLSTEERLIKMGCEDANILRRLEFFYNIVIR